MRKVAIIAALGLAISACATKDFGRMELSPVAGLDCQQLAAEQGRVDAFYAAIDDKDDWDARTLVASTLLDFGYGNHRDKKKALASAEARRAQLTAAQRAQGCPV